MNNKLRYEIPGFKDLNSEAKTKEKKKQDN